MIIEPPRTCSEPEWRHRLYTKLACGAAFFLSFILWRPWIRVVRKADVPLEHGLILCGHPGLYDSFAYAITYWPFWRLLKVLLFELWRLPWNVPDRSNYLSWSVTRGIIGHMKCVPADRGDAGKTFGAMQPLADLIKSGANVCLFPTFGRMRWPVRVDPHAVKFVYSLARECQRDGIDLKIVIGRMSGEPLWGGPRIGRSRWSQVSQFLRSYFQQVFFHRLLIEYESIDLSDLVSQKPSAAVYREIAERIAEAITPRDPKFIYKPEATESPA